MNDFHQKLSVGYVILLSLQVPLNLAFLALAVGASGAGLPVPGGVMLLLYLALAAVYFAALGVLGVLSIVKAFKAYRQGAAEHCLRAALIFKYGLVPFFIVNFCSLFVLFLLPFAASRGTIVLIFPLALPVAFLLLCLAVGCSWLAMLPGSFYGVQLVRLSRDAGKIKPSAAKWHILLQFFFLTDVLDTMYLAALKWRRGRVGAVIIGLVYLLALLLLALQIAV